MLPIIFAVFWAIVCPHHTHTGTNNNGSQVTTLDDDGDGGEDTGGETGRIPPQPPTPPHP